MAKTLDHVCILVKDIDQDASSTSIVVVLNWTEELKRLEQDLLK